MTPEKMVRMANQIATFFESQPHADKAGQVAAHLIEFWEPRMLEKLSIHVSEGGDGMSELAIDGAKRVLDERT